MDAKPECTVSPVIGAVVLGNQMWTFRAKTGDITRPYFSNEEKRAISNRAKLIKTLKGEGFKVLQQEALQ